MVNSDFADLVSMDFFFSLVEACNSLYKQDPSMTLSSRMQAALELPSFVPRIDGIYARLPNENLFRDFLYRLLEVLGYFSEDGAYKVLSHPGMTKLHYLRYEDNGAAWHNLEVSSARNRLLSELKGILQKYFPNWEMKQASERLRTVPPYSLLQDEFTPLEKEISSALSIDFVIAFLKTTYIVHLGTDLVPNEFPREDNQSVNSRTIKIGEMLRNNRPRYIAASHTDFFRKIRTQPPFSNIYDESLSKLRAIDNNEAVLEDALLSLTFKLSLPYAHSIINCPEFIESMGGSGPLAGTGNFYRMILWILAYSSDIDNNGGYLNRFSNPRNLRVHDIVHYIPLVVELLSISVDGSFAVELYTALDSTQSTPDEEFDDA